MQPTVLFCFSIAFLTFSITNCENEFGPSNPVVRKLFGVESDGTLLLPLHKRMTRGSGYNRGQNTGYNSYMVSCNTCNSCSGCTSTNTGYYPNTGSGTYYPNTGSSIYYPNTGTGNYYPNTNTGYYPNTGCNQPNCNQQTNQVVNVCVWQYQCSAQTTCDNCGNAMQSQSCQWRCNNYCQNYMCG